MAIYQTCSQCGNPFSKSASSPKYLCDECDGTNARKRAAQECWDTMTTAEKCEELKSRLDALERQPDRNMPIG